MSNTCLVCRHSELKEIDADLVNGVPLRDIAQSVSLSTASLHRHRKNHVAKRLVRARETAANRSATNVVRAEAMQATDLLVKVDDLYSRAKGLLDKAEKAEKYGPAASAIREATRLTELLARLQGDLQSGTTVNVQTNIVAAPEWLIIRSAVFTALTPFPEARAAVSETLATLEASDTE